MASDNRKDELCRSFGFSGERQLYHFLAGCAQGGLDRVIRRGLTARVLAQLGYDAARLLEIGFNLSALKILGVRIEERTTAQELATPDPGHRDVVEAVKRLLAEGCMASQFFLKGFTIHHLKKAGCTIQDCERAAYRLEDLVSAYSAAELRRAGYGIRELRRFYRGQDLRAAGFSATDMRMAGYSIRDLQGFGYNDNHIRTAGYSLNDLIRSGLGRTTIDKIRGM
jgi:intracellular multiplication protein IcmE